MSSVAVEHDGIKPCTPDEVITLLRPLVERLHRGHCWVRRPKVKKPSHIPDPFDEVKLREHVAGGFLYGLCPIAPGESTTKVALLDFDAHGGESDTPWEEMRRVADAVAFALEQDGYRPTLFRSSGGRGVHLFLLWDAPQDAYSVREMLREALASCGLESGTGGVARGAVEIFPKQDAVPASGFGSMFILPLGAGTRSELLSV